MPAMAIQFYFTTYLSMRIFGKPYLLRGLAMTQMIRVLFICVANAAAPSWQKRCSDTLTPSASRLSVPALSLVKSIRVPWQRLRI